MVGFEVNEIVVNFEGKSFRITRDAVITAFNKAPDVLQDYSKSRFYVEKDKDLKPVKAVFAVLIPDMNVNSNGVPEALLADALKVLDFEVLDYRRHHLE